MEVSLLEIFKKKKERKLDLGTDLPDMLARGSWATTTYTFIILAYLSILRSRIHAQFDNQYKHKSAYIW